VKIKKGKMVLKEMKEMKEMKEREGDDGVIIFLCLLTF